MAHIDLPAGLPGIRSLLAFRPDTAAPIAALTNALMCSPGTLTAGEREAIAAYVSALNGCAFCRNSHQAIAACHLGDAVASQAVADPDTAPLSEKLKALLALAARVQRSGRDVGAADIGRARAAGATDREIHDAVLIAAAFCMFNRYVDGLAAWTPDDPAIYRASAARVVEHGYTL